MSVLIVDIDLNVIDSSKRRVVRRFFTMLSNVRDMTISQTTLEGICVYLKHEQLPQFPHLIRLHAVLYNSDLGNLANILESCQNLKSLVLELINLKEEELLILSSVPKCLRSSLEYLEIKTPIRGDVAEIELVTYFLENSAVLKKLKMYLRCWRMNEESIILMQLLRLRRCSPSCEVVAQLEELEETSVKL
ncbi:unnamed protein product [Brassica napus]|uniref:(rape) hypothetical protein n=1 Tax=Brassica napus TaxID=3708 RepID=A0A816V8J5_BRANA|nr:unnamed protein product [Brassica napus]